MVRYYRPYFYRKPSQMRLKSKKPKKPSVSSNYVVTPAQNDQSIATEIQNILNAHIVNATVSWGRISYRKLTGQNLQALVANSFRNTDNVIFKGVKVSVFNPNTTMLIAYRHKLGDPLRVITGTEKIKAGFMFPENTMPVVLYLISENETTFKLRFSYNPTVIRSIL